MEKDHKKMEKDDSNPAIASLEILSKGFKIEKTESNTTEWRSTCVYIRRDMSTSVMERTSVAIILS